MRAFTLERVRGDSFSLWPIPKPGTDPVRQPTPTPKPAIIADKHQTTEDQDVVGMLRRVAETPNDLGIRPRVPQGGHAAHFDGAARFLDFGLRHRLPDEVRVVVSFSQGRQKIRRLGFGSSTCQTITGPSSACVSRPERVELARCVSGESSRMLVDH